MTRDLPVASLLVKYRPTTFDGLVGHKEVVHSLRGVLKARSCRAFCFTGPSGVGKTTLARILARAVGCYARDLKEVDAATYTGIDAMRAITDTLDYQPISGGEVRVIIIDEAHALSRPAWQSLLKSVEEPPPHIWWVFCSTEPAKIPETIRTRCLIYDLRPVDPDDIYHLLQEVVKPEKVDASDDVLYFIAQQSEGSPRRALVYLAQAGEAKSPRQAAAILKKVIAEEEGPAIQLARLLVNGKLTWVRAAQLLRNAGDVNPESVRLTILAYLSKVALGTKREDTAGRMVELLDAFGTPCNSSEGWAPILLAIGRAIFGT